MSTELTDRAERGLCDVEAAGAFLRGPYFEAVVCRSVRQAVVEAQSPFVSRADAAARWRCSTTEIDRAVKAGVLTKLTRGGTPLFLKQEGDDAIREGKWRK